MPRYCTSVEVKRERYYVNHQVRVKVLNHPTSHFFVQSYISSQKPKVPAIYSFTCVQLQ